MLILLSHGGREFISFTCYSFLSEIVVAIIILKTKHLSKLAQLRSEKVAVKVLEDTIDSFHIAARD